MQSKVAQGTVGGPIFWCHKNKQLLLYCSDERSEWCGWLLEVKHDHYIAIREAKPHEVKLIMDRMKEYDTTAIHN